MSVQISSRGDEASSSEPGEPPVMHRDFADIYRAHDRRIFRYCLAYLRNAADAEEATQETFARAARRLDLISGDIGPYLTAIARNVCYDVRRYYPHQHVAIEDADGHLTVGGPETQTLDRSLLERVVTALTRNEQRLLAFAYAGYTYDEIARRTGMSSKAVSVAITRARQRLRRLAAAGTLVVLGATAAWRWLQRTARQVANSAAAMSDALMAAGQSTLLLALVAAALPGVAAATSATAGTPARPVAVGLGEDPASPFPPDGAPRIRPGGAPVSRAATGSPADARGAMAAAPLQIPSIFEPPPSEYQSRFQSMTASPAYASDHTLFASAASTAGCVGGCPLLFRSHDGGATWQDVNDTTFPGGPVVLPPTYPADPTVYAMSMEGLVRSPDGGSTFEAVPILPVGPGAATAAPPAGGDHGGVLVAPAAGSGQTWRDAGGAVSPGPTLPAGLVPVAVAYAGASTLVAVEEPVRTFAAGTQLVVVVCAGLQCRPTATLPDDASRPVLAVSPSYASDHAIAVATNSAVFLSTTGAASFQPVSGVAAEITAAAFRPATATRPASLLVAAFRGGATVLDVVVPSPAPAATSLATNVPAGVDISALVIPAADHLLADMFPRDVVGIAQGVRCSVDGSTWAWTC
jgi:RNA polymerase sigma-70 factor (ECF subfamily)